MSKSASSNDMQKKYIEKYIERLKKFNEKWEKLLTKKKKILKLSSNEIDDQKKKRKEVMEKLNEWKKNNLFIGKNVPEEFYAPKKIDFDNVLETIKKNKKMYYDDVKHLKDLAQKKKDLLIGDDNKVKEDIAKILIDWYDEIIGCPDFCAVVLPSKEDDNIKDWFTIRELEKRINIRTRCKKHSQEIYKELLKDKKDHEEKFKGVPLKKPWPFYPFPINTFGDFTEEETAKIIKSAAKAN